MVFYIDVRTPGKNFDEFYRRAAEEYQVDYRKGQVGKIYEEDGHLMVQGSDLLEDRQVLMPADLVGTGGWRWKRRPMPGNWLPCSPPVWIITISLPKRTPNCAR